MKDNSLIAQKQVKKVCVDLSSNLVAKSSACSLSTLTHTTVAALTGGSGTGMAAEPSKQEKRSLLTNPLPMPSPDQGEKGVKQTKRPVFQVTNQLREETEIIHTEPTPKKEDHKENRRRFQFKNVKPLSALTAAPDKCSTNQAKPAMRLLLDISLRAQQSPQNATAGNDRIKSLFSREKNFSRGRSLKSNNLSEKNLHRAGMQKYSEPMNLSVQRWPSVNYLERGAMRNSASADKSQKGKENVFTLDTQADKKSDKASVTEFVNLDFKTYDPHAATREFTQIVTLTMEDGMLLFTDDIPQGMDA
eukprot:TRINITY_DN11034_c0_g1_i1.p1 TRINITY_DN11034_c0_g1~~TRINITY_DN11034_c0_g1_i1.p1  ORF type:complete len:304 (-),score=46.22 TRINITY_DN11034_c0_g1_i1:93-1004(-)